MSLGKMSITIATKDLQNGIHNVTGMNNLMESIIPKNLNEIENYINAFYTNNNFDESYSKIKEEDMYFVYAKNYEKNIQEILANAN